MKYIKNILIFFFVWGCAGKDVDEPKSVLNHLNGDHYQAQESNPRMAYAFPLIGTRKNKLSHVSGVLLLKEGLMYIPLNHKSIDFVGSNNEKVAEAITQGDGSFKISQKLKNGFYRLTIRDSGLKGELEVEIKSYETKGLKFIVQKK